MVDGAFDIVSGLGEDNDVAVVADALEVGQGYGVGYASVEHEPAVADFDGASDHRHRSGGAEPF